MAGGKIEDVYRLSPIQQGILFHTLGAPRSGIYFEQFSLRYDQGFEPEAFAAAWQSVVSRHPVLRSAFLWEDLDEPLQGVHRVVEVPIDRQDWRGRDPNDADWTKRDRLLAAYVVADRQKGFDLGRPPLLRLAILRLTDEAYQVVWGYHHLVLDGWSAGLIMREVGAAYQAALLGREADVPTRRPFRDYVGWLRKEKLGEQNLGAAEAFWRRHLEGITRPTALPIEQGDRGDGTDTDQTWILDLRRLPESLTQALKNFAKRLRFTLNTVLQGAWALLLAHYSGSSKVVFGVTVSGRPPALRGADTMVGCFINTLPMAVDVAPHQALVPWLQGLLREQLAMRSFEHTPLGSILRWTNQPARQELFQSILVFESFTVESSFEMTHSGVFQRTNYPLTVVASPDREMAIRIGFDRGHFHDRDIARVHDHLRTLFEAMVAVDQDGPADRARIGDLEMVTAAERQTLLATWNQTAVEVPKDTFLDHLQAQVSRRPNSVAARDCDRDLTYAQLSDQAHRLATCLVHHGVGPEVRVAICLTRSTNMIVAILAVLESGGAFVPLDPEHPSERLAYVLADARVAVILGETATTARIETLRSTLAASNDLPRKNVPRVLTLDSLPTTTGPTATRGRHPAGPDNLAYLIYTSGSTGQPKGVGIARRALDNFLEAMSKHPGLSPDDVLLAVTTLSFDIALLELLLPLRVGACVVIADEEEVADAHALQARLRACGATTMQATPATWRLFLSEDPNDTGRGLHNLRVFSGGEALAPGLAAALGARTQELWNLYGPTETTVWSTVAPIQATPLQAGEGRAAAAASSVVIGRPVDNTQIYLVDATLGPVPVGLPGEILIGGTGLARGYQGRPALTAERFVPDPFTDPSVTTTGGRLYRTGDLGRYQADGTLECLGRLDDQIKMRGFRIEPGEIETALLRHPTIREAAVLALDPTFDDEHGEARADDDPSDRRLTAFLVPAAGASVVPVDVLRPFLATILPTYMVPDSYITLDALPLTPNNKVDRRALRACPEAQGARPSLSVERTPPRTEAERELVTLFETVLDRRPIGIHDRFFDLGGHSLLAVRLVGKIRKRFDPTFPLSALLRHDTVAALGNRLAANPEEPIAEATEATERTVLVPLGPRPVSPPEAPLFLVHPIGGDVMCYTDLAGHLEPRVSIVAVQSPDPGHPAFASLGALADHHLEALRTVQPRGPYRLGGWSMGGVVAFEMAIQLHARNEHVDQLWLLDARPAALLEFGPDVGATALDEKSRVAWFARDLAGLGRGTLEALLKDPPGDTVGDGKGDTLLLRMLTAARAQGLVPPELDDRQTQRLFARFCANLDIFRQHVPRAYPGRVTLVRAQPANDGGESQRSKGDASGRDTLGWNTLAAGGVTTLSIDADHYSLLHGAAVETLAGLLVERLNPPSVVALGAHGDASQ